MVDVHSALYNTLLLLYLGLTVWALFFIATARTVDGAFRSTYVLGIVAAVIQGVAGVALYLSDYARRRAFTTCMALAWWSLPEPATPSLTVPLTAGAKRSTSAWRPRPLLD